MSIAKPSLVVSYKATADFNTKYVVVAIDTGAGTCKLPAANGDKKLMLGVTQATAKSGHSVAVCIQGLTYAKSNGTIARGGRAQADVTAGNEGKIVALADPSVPANASGGGTNAEVDAVRDYATANRDLIENTIGFVEEATADEDLVVLRLGKVKVTA